MSTEPMITKTGCEVRVLAHGNDPDTYGILLNLSVDTRRAELMMTPEEAAKIGRMLLDQAEKAGAR